MGREGVAIDTMADMEALLADIDLENISVSLTINPTAWILLAMYVALAEKRGYDLNKLSGTVQADILKHTIKQYENTIETHLSKNDVAADKLKWDDHSDLREKVEMFEKIINELRGELIVFLAKYI